MRKRKIINDPTGGTGNCPHLVEAIPCEDPRCYDWLVAKLEECIPDNERDCGPGTRNPQVQCVNSDGLLKWIGILLYHAFALIRLHPQRPRLLCWDALVLKW